MALVHAIKASHYDTRLGRFQSLAFKPSSPERGGGLSVFDRECAKEDSGGICDHIRRYYETVVEEPAIFWEFDRGILPDNCRFVENRSTSGDKCHINIIDIDEDEAADLIKAVPITDMRICTNGDSIEFSEAELENKRRPAS